MFGSIGKPDGPTLCSAYTMVDELDAGVLLVIEATGEEVTVNQYVDSLSFKVLKFIQLQVLVGAIAACCG